MRNPARIGPMLDALRRVWERSPDLRLGQVVSNAARNHPAWPDVFSIEDDVLLRGIEAMTSPSSTPANEVEGLVADALKGSSGRG